MATDQFSLCWNNFHSNLSSGFHSLYQSEDFVDVTLAADGRYLKAHKIVLSVCSQYFKELFQVNPCKHPIVILKDVSYCALRDLLQFMYLGEVSVSQEELGNLMKVAELLQIKGLTEENGTSPVNQNGMKNIHITDVKTVREPRTFLKRSKALKKTKSEIPVKIVKSDATSEGRESISTPTRRDSADGGSVASSILEPELMVVPVQPKQEPETEPGGENPSESGKYSEHSFPEMDISAMLDTSLGIEKASHSSTPICWKSELPMYASSSDSKPPGGLRFLTTPKGRTVVIHNGHMYTLSHQKETKTTWVCVMQRKLNCAGCVTTANGPMLLSYSGHNHAQLNDIIQRLDTASLK